MFPFKTANKYNYYHCRTCCNRVFQELCTNKNNSNLGFWEQIKENRNSSCTMQKHSALFQLWDAQTR